jgi:hypothetical protein
MVRLFHFRKETRNKRSIFVHTNVMVPLELIVAIGKRHIVGVAEFGNESAVVERTIFPLMKPQEPEEIARELLRKLGIPESEWDEILKTKREIVI